MIKQENRMHGPRYGFLLIICAALLACAGSEKKDAAVAPELQQIIYWFYDDGGEHGYFGTCASLAADDEIYVRDKNKLVQVDRIRGFLGQYTEQTECCDVTRYYYVDEKVCNAHLKKARAWYDREYPENVR